MCCFIKTDKCALKINILNSKGMSLRIFCTKLNYKNVKHAHIHTKSNTKRSFSSPPPPQKISTKISFK